MASKGKPNGAPEQKPVDKIDAAIEASQNTETHRQLTVTIASTGRHVGLSYPVDLNDSELLELIGFMGSTLRLAQQQERARQGGPQLLVARSLPTN